MATYVTPLPGPGPTGPKPPLRMVNRSPSLLRNGSCNLKSNAAKRKSAVELLQESKAFYVKSEQVLDSKQELKHSEHLQVTANPNFDVLLKTPVRVSHSWEGHHHPQQLQQQQQPQQPAPPQPPSRKSINVAHTQVIQNGTGNAQHQQLHEGLIQNTDHSIIIATKVQQQLHHHHQHHHQQQQHTNFNHVIHEGIPTSALNSQGPSLPVVPTRTVQPLAEVTKGNSPPGLPPKSPRSLRPRSKTQPEAHSVALAHQCFQLGSQNQRPEYRRSHSERDTSDDFQIRLRRLLNTDSKENLDTVCPHPTPATFTCVEPSSAIPLKTCPVPVPCRATTTTATATSTSIHKSMPDLSPLKLRQGLRRPQGSTSTTSTSSSASVRCEQHPNTVTVTETPAPPVLPCPPQVTPSSSTPKVISSSPGWSVALDQANRNSVRRPILRSKSDISHRYSKSGPDLTQCGASRSSRSLADLERFFDKMGLDGGAFYQLHAGPSDSSPPVFFNSVSSLSSSCCKAGGTSEEESTATSPQCHGNVGKDVMAQKEGLTNENLSQHGPVETSIVERNARVIKWLYNCRKAS